VIRIISARKATKPEKHFYQGNDHAWIIRFFEGT
jgi:hypothetical protein